MSDVVCFPHGILRLRATFVQHYHVAAHGSSGTSCYADRKDYVPSADCNFHIGGPRALNRSVDGIKILGAGGGTTFASKTIEHLGSIQNYHRRV
eukprot:104693-Pyramimonas_sp.AAC.1